MSSEEKRVLVASVAAFLRAELASEGVDDGLSADARESLEVGVQCLEAVYKPSGEGTNAIQIVDLLKIVRYYLATKTVSPEAKAEAERLKNEGNELMKAKKFTEALDRYSKAIQIDDHNAVYFCNRAAAHFKLKDNEAAVKDCLSALAIDPNYSKAHVRLGFAYTNLEKNEEALTAHYRAMQLEPDNESYCNNYRLAEERLAQDPRSTYGLRFLTFRERLENPTMINMVTEILAEPGMRDSISEIVSPVFQHLAENNGGGMNTYREAGQLLIEQMQQADPELLEHLSRRMHLSPDSWEQ